MVLTGVSGSGKSSLVFDTLYAEAQRRYVESLSAYLRQELKQMQKPMVGYINGLPPAISIEQRRITSNPRATVGTVTEVIDYLRILYMTIGRPHCHVCGTPFEEGTPQSISRAILESHAGAKVKLLAPVVRERKGSHRYTLSRLRREGYDLVRIDGRYLKPEEVEALDGSTAHSIEVIVGEYDITMDASAEEASPIQDYVQQALELGRGALIVDSGDGEGSYSTLRACSACGSTIPEPTIELFNWNHPDGMCKSCNGLGTLLEVDVAKIVVDPTISILDGALRSFDPNRIKSNRWAVQRLRSLAEHYGVDLSVPWSDLPEGFRDVVLNGSREETYKFNYHSERSGFTTSRDYVYEGLIPSIERRFRETSSDYARQYYQTFMTQQPCPSCHGARLRPEVLAVRVGGKNLAEVGEMSVGEIRVWLEDVRRDAQGEVFKAAAEQIIGEVGERLRFLDNVGLHYLNLNRRAVTLSAGEGQRIRLATQIGSGLVGVLYVLDEPTIGLHPHDIGALLENINHLRDLGNTVIVVEHDPTIIRNADHIVDIGPGAGIHGGEVVAEGSPAEITTNPDSVTGRYLTGELEVTPVEKESRSPPEEWIILKGARLHNLKDLTLRIPLGRLTCVTGVSGSGKSSLVTQTLYPAIAYRTTGYKGSIGPHDSIEGLEHLDKVVAVDQSPIGQTPRSCLGTYSKVFNEIRKVFSKTELAQERGYNAGTFSYNQAGGRCEDCRGYGSKRINMHFLADVWVRCPRCEGARYKKEVLEVTYRDRNIYEVMEMDVNEALEFFSDHPKITGILETVKAVGLDYMKLGQITPTFSGGEAQRARLARELSKPEKGRTLYILDEPTTGLHFADVQKLLDVLNLLVNRGNTVVIIEHNLDVIKNADWIIDLGPEGGARGGFIVAEGEPEHVAGITASLTGQCLTHALGLGGG